MQVNKKSFLLLMAMMIAVPLALFLSCVDSLPEEGNSSATERTDATYTLDFRKIDYPNSNQTRSIGDGEFDVLGYGYNAFEGLLDNPSGVKGKVIDFERLKSGKGIDPLTGEEVTLSPINVHNAELPGQIRYYENYNTSLTHFVFGMAADASFSLDSLNLDFSHFPKIPVIPVPSIPIPGTGFSLPGQDIDIVGMIQDVANILPWGAVGFYVKGGFGLDHKKSKAYHQTNVLLEKRRIFFEDLSFLKYFLTPGFRHALQEMTGEEILTSYGTHLLTDFEVGSRISITSSAYEKNVRDSLLGALGGKLFEVIQGNASVNMSLYKDLKEVSIEVVQFGGGAPKYYPPVNPDNKEIIDPDIFNWEEWKNSVEHTNSVLILADTGESLPLLSLVDDPAIKAKIKRAILKKSAELEQGKKEIRYYYLDETTGGRFQITPNLDKNLRKFDAFTYLDKKAIFSEYLFAGPGSYGLGFIFPHLIDSSLAPNYRLDYFKSIVNEKTGEVSILSTNLQQFLCRDGKFRTAQEDVDGLRFWVPMYKYQGEKDY